MLDRFKGSRTQRLPRRADADVAAALERTAQRLDEVANRLDAMARRLDELEQRPRGDLLYMQEQRAAQQSADFVVENMPKASVFWHPHDTLRFALGEIKGPGLALEFGVATGATLAVIANEVADEREVVGFDSFAGLPETWRTGYPAGAFAETPPQYISGASIVAGLFDETLPAFLAGNNQPIAFVHLDADLYSSTKAVLDLIGDRLSSDAVLVFNEFFNYPGWQRHEFLAFQEFVAGTGRRYEYLAYTGDHQQVVVRVH
jgi:predicted O-methyltransferase YrrM